MSTARAAAAASGLAAVAGLSLLLIGGAGGASAAPQAKPTCGTGKTPPCPSPSPSPSLSPSPSPSASPSPSVSSTPSPSVSPTPSPSASPTPSSCAGVTVTPADDLQAKINANPAGTTFCLQAGTHRITASSGLTPLAGDVFTGVGTAAVVDGAKVVNGWALSGSDWVAPGFLPSSTPPAAACETTSPLCGQPQDVFLDGVWLQPVSSRTALAPGKVFRDYTANRIYVRDDPTGRLVEQSWATHLFTGSAPNVQIRNLTLQHAASPPNVGALDPSSGGTGWVLDHNDVRWNHGYGTGPGGASYGQTLALTITANHVHHNGQDGTGADGNGNLVQGNEVDHNSFAGYDDGWDAGNKFGHAGSLVVTGNYFHDERGPAIWCDINCNGVTIDHNYVSNSQRGIMFEISCSASIHDNTIVNSTDPDPNGWDGIGILVAESQDVTVYNNSIYASSPASRGVWAIQQDRTEARDCTAGAEHVVKNLNVHDNSEDLNSSGVRFGGKTGLWTDTGRTDLYGSAFNNTFTHNTYHQTTPASVWDWGMTGTKYSNTISWSAWQAAGKDTTGTVVADDPAPPPPPVLVVGPQP
jgi:hypothetical protein